MSETRRLPHQTDIKQLKVQAKDLLKAYERGDARALELFNEYHPSGTNLKTPKLSDAQLVLARTYGFASWPKLRAAATSQVDLRKLIHFFEINDTHGVTQFVKTNPGILERKDVLGRAVRHGNLEMVKLMYELGARDVQTALGYTVYKTKKEIAKYLIAQGASMSVPSEDAPIIVGACEVLNPASLQMVLDFSDDALDQATAHQCIAMLLSTYCRDPKAKHECLQILTHAGFGLPETPTMAVHQGRIDLLETCLNKDPDLFARKFSQSDIYPPAFGIKPGDGLHLAPLAGATLLHMAVEYCEMEILHWMIDKGVNVNVTSRVDKDGFGGHTALFQTTVSITHHDASRAELLLKHGADPNARATIRIQLRYMGNPDLEKMKEFHNVTAIGFARQFQIRAWVSEPSIRVISNHGGTE